MVPPSLHRELSDGLVSVFKRCVEARPEGGVVHGADVERHLSRLLLQLVDDAAQLQGVYHAALHREPTIQQLQQKVRYI